LSGANDPARRADNSRDDGILTGLEILGLDLRGTELVMLSACHTGQGRAEQGEGVAGVRRAFQVAGAGSVAATIWAVPDEATKDLMTHFWANVAAGSGSADALCQAQRQYLNDRRAATGGAAHPHFWAAFSVTGANRPLPKAADRAAARAALADLLPKAAAARKRGDRQTATELLIRATAACQPVPGELPAYQSKAYQVLAELAQETADDAAAARWTATARRFGGADSSWAIDIAEPPTALGLTGIDLKRAVMIALLRDAYRTAERFRGTRRCTVRSWMTPNAATRKPQRPQPPPKSNGKWTTIEPPPWPATPSL
jgi:hypothetical protein